MNFCSPILFSNPQERIVHGYNLSTKVVLVAVSLLFASGGIAAYTTQLGLPYVIAFSTASVGCMGLFIIACVCSAKTSHAPLGSPNPSIAQVDIEPPTMEQKCVTMTDYELIDELKFLGDEYSSDGEDSLDGEYTTDEDCSSDEENSIDGKYSSEEEKTPSHDQWDIRNLLIARLTSYFASNRENPTMMAKLLQPLLDYAKQNQINGEDKLSLLIQSIIESNNRELIYVAQVFEKVVDEDNKIKRSLSVAFATYIAQECIESIDQYICLANKNNFKGNCLKLDSELVFGKVNFKKNPLSLPVTLSAAIGIAFLRKAIAHIQESERLLEQQKLNEDDPAGFMIIVEQTEHCRFPASMIGPVLEYLVNFPGLVSLYLLNVGAPNLSELSDRAYGFSDEHFEALNNIMTKNPHLMEFRVNLDGMSENKKEECIKQLDLLSSLNKEYPPKIGTILSNYRKKFKHELEKD